jgi:hypothetical protein
MGYVFLFAVFVGVVALARAYRNSRGRLPATSWSNEDHQYAGRVWSDHHVARAQPIKMICGPVPACVNHDEHVLSVLPAINLLEPRTVRPPAAPMAGPRSG